MTISGDSNSQTFRDRLWPPRRIHFVVLGGIVGLVAVVIAAIALVDNLNRVAVPDLVGQSPLEAAEAIVDAGLIYEPDEEVSDGVCTTDPPVSDYCEVTSQSLAAETRIRPGTTVVLALEVIEVVVPDLVGLSFDDAVDLAADVHLRVKPDNNLVLDVSGHGEWKVLEQSRDVDESIEAGMNIEVTLDAPLVDVPQVVGLPFGTATEMLEAVGITAGFSSVPGNYLDGSVFVREMDPAPDGGQVPIGSKVNLSWGLKVPDVVGSAEGEAVRILQDAGFTVTGSTVGSDRVTKQTPAAGAITEPTKEVALTLAPPTVVYEVVSDGSHASITWIAPGSYNISQATDAQVPWKMTFETEADYRNFNAQTMNGSTITCNIYVNGELRKTNTSTGQYSVVSCG